MDPTRLCFGVFMPQIAMRFEQVLEKARVAEAQGFDALWLMDHLWAPGATEADCLEGWTLATALAVRTERLRLGHMVLCNAFRHPALLAKMSATLDHVSGERVSHSGLFYQLRDAIARPRASSSSRAT